MAVPLCHAPARDPRVLHKPVPGDHSQSTLNPWDALAGQHGAGGLRLAGGHREGTQRERFTAELLPSLQWDSFSLLFLKESPKPRSSGGMPRCEVLLTAAN